MQHQSKHHVNYQNQSMVVCLICMWYQYKYNHIVGFVVVDFVVVVLLLVVLFTLGGVDVSITFNLT